VTPVSGRLFFQQLTCSVVFLPFGKLLLNICLCLEAAFLMTSYMRSSPRNSVAVLG